MAEKKLTDKELVDLGQKIQNFYELGYVNKKSALGYTFLKGIAQGFGIFLGGTVVVALVAWILGAFDQVPFVKSLVEAIQRSV